MTNPEVRHVPQDAGFPYLIDKKPGKNGADDIVISTGEENPRDFLEAKFFPLTGEFRIWDFETGLRRSGVGKKLLRRALVKAKELGAKQITATIISRECLNSVQSVFGEESVTVDDLGVYGRLGSTGARLNYPL